MESGKGYWDLITKWKTWFKKRNCFKLRKRCGGLAPSDKHDLKSRVRLLATLQRARFDNVPGNEQGRLQCYCLPSTDWHRYFSGAAEITVAQHNEASNFEEEKHAAQNVL